MFSKFSKYFTTAKMSSQEAGPQPSGWTAGQDRKSIDGLDAKSKESRPAASVVSQKFIQKLQTMAWLKPHSNPPFSILPKRGRGDFGRSEGRNYVVNFWVRTLV